MGTLARSEFKELTLKERLQVKRSNAALILDGSSSMNEEIEPGRSKMIAMHEIVGGIKGDPRIIYFSTDAREIRYDELPTRGSGITNMAQAINLCKSLGIKSAVMITDGDASDKAATLQAAEGFTLQILYVGAGIRPKFLEDLAAKCGGFCSKDDIKLTKELTSKVQLLLGDGSGPKGNIQL